MIITVSKNKGIKMGQTPNFYFSLILMLFFFRFLMKLTAWVFSKQIGPTSLHGFRESKPKLNDTFF
jgi:hypothetical protein